MLYLVIGKDAQYICHFPVYPAPAFGVPDPKFTDAGLGI